MTIPKYDYEVSILELVCILEDSGEWPCDNLVFLVLEAIACGQAAPEKLYEGLDEVIANFGGKVLEREGLVQ